MALTGRVGLVALCGVLIVGLFAPSWFGILLMLGIIFLGVALDLLFAGSIRQLAISRDGDRTTRLGEPVQVRLTIVNRGTRLMRGLLRDAWPPSAGSTMDRHPITIPSGERRHITSTLVPTRRGERAAHRITVRSVGPLGLAARQGHHDVPWSIRVVPPFHSRKHVPGRLARLRELDGRQAMLIRGHGTEFDSLREYVLGDDVRSIDWRATARASDVMVRTWRPERDQQVLIVIDTGRMAAGRVGDAPRLDTAIESTLLLSVLAAHAGDHVDVTAFDRSVRLDVRRISKGTTSSTLVTALAPLEANLIETDWRAMVSHVFNRVSRRALVVIMTTLDGSTLSQGLLPILPSLTSRHHVVVASVSDPEISQLAQGRGDAELVYGAAAAEQALAERRTVAERLRRAGVDVVDAPPEQLPPRLADHYLELKLSGRL